MLINRVRFDEWMKTEGKEEEGVALCDRAEMAEVLLPCRRRGKGMAELAQIKVTFGGLWMREDAKMQLAAPPTSFALGNKAILDCSSIVMQSANLLSTFCHAASHNHLLLSSRMLADVD